MHLSKKNWFRGLGILVLFFMAYVGARGGDLNPPAGLVLPTMKTLSEVEPRIAVNANNTPGDADSLFKITAPGSYYLTGNITGVSAKHGIEVVAEQAGPGDAVPVCSFRIADGVPGGEVYRRVEAVRNDLRMRLHGAPVEREKTGPERGRYQHPEYYGQPPEKGMDYDAERERSSPVVLDSTQR